MEDRAHGVDLVESGGWPHRCFCHLKPTISNVRSEVSNPSPGISNPRSQIPDHRAVRLFASGRTPHCSPPRRLLGGLAGVRLFPANPLVERRRCFGAHASAALAGAARPGPGSTTFVGTTSLATDQTASEPSPTAVADEAEHFKQEAMDVARRLTGDLPTSLAALAAAATVYDETGNTDEALRCWQQYLKLAPERPEAHNALGLIALQKGQYEEAVACWRKTLQLSPDLPGVHQRLAHALMGLGQMAEAAAALEQEVKISPQASRPYYLLGQTRTQLGQFQPAQESYEKAIELNPEELDAYYGLGNALARLGRQEQAAAVREKWTRLKAEYWKTHLDLRSQYDDARTMRQMLARTCMLVAGVYAQHRHQAMRNCSGPGSPNSNPATSSPACCCPACTKQHPGPPRPAACASNSPASSRPIRPTT